MNEGFVNGSVNNQKKYIDRIDDSVFAVNFCIGSDAVFVFLFLKIINLKSWEGGVKPVLDRPKQG